MNELALTIMISQISVENGVCTGWPIIGEMVRKDITIQIDSTSLERVEKTTKGQLKILGQKVLQKSVNETIDNCKNEVFRQNIRKDQLRREIRCSVKQTLCSRSHNRSCDLGICNVETDLHLFKLDLCHKYREYSYRNQNIDCLDKLLGKGWDLFTGQTSCHFVTSLKVKLAPSLHLHLKIKTAEYPAIIGDKANYRSTLYDHMLHV